MSVVDHDCRCSVCVSLNPLACPKLSLLAARPCQPFMRATRQLRHARLPPGGLGPEGAAAPQGELAGLGPQAAHAGVLSAAAALAADLARHRILDLLLLGEGPAARQAPSLEPGSDTGAGSLREPASARAAPRGADGEAGGGAAAAGGQGAAGSPGQAHKAALHIESSACGGGSATSGHNRQGLAEQADSAACSSKSARGEAERWHRSVAAIRRRRLDCRVRAPVRARVLHA
jgi:hypothetical protein